MAGLVEGGFPKLPQRRDLDLSHPLAGESQEPPRLPQTEWLPAVEAEPQPENLALALAKNLEETVHIAAPGVAGCEVELQVGVWVRHPVADL